MSARLAVLVAAATLVAAAAGPACAAGGAPPPDAPPAGQAEKPKAEAPRKLSPEERMARRLPQPVKVSYLIGLPMLDERNGTLGRVRTVVRSREGKVKLVIGYGGLFGIGQRLIAVPVEVVAMLGRQVAAVDMPAAEFEPAPTWFGSGDDEIGPGEIIRVGVMRR